ncbi:hypothetical protein LTS10_003736 [Elasticomyces elasticus]|nr:hypothetical protein LTS10_003736 [Elasticomyces elasticus]
MADTTPSRLLALPAELREMIWDYTLAGTIVQIPIKKDYAYAFRETRLRLLWAKCRFYFSDLQAIEEQANPAILRTSKQIRHEALPRSYIFSVFRFDNEETLLGWLSARSALERRTITKVEFMLEDFGLGPAAAGYVARAVRGKSVALESMLIAEGLALGEGVLQTRVGESRYQLKCL